jgi:acetylornithine deacetylase/succinyl-diaminopimelate desuccinylase-like protein
VETLKRFGAEVKVYEIANGNPTVHGVFGSDPNLPTVTVYNHMDVQPASKATEPWDTEPFVMTTKGDSYFGRGTTDDKGPALAALAAAKHSFPVGV